MADFYSSQNGNWSASSTWGGAGVPGAGDNAIIQDEVTYDVGDSSVQRGNVTISSGGVLIFPTNATSRLRFNTTGVITINSGGELRIGTESTPIGSSYKVKLHWPQGSSTRNVIVLNSGGYLYMYGDPAVYGSEMKAELQSDWTSGQTFYIKGDFSAKWQSGQRIAVDRHQAYSSTAYQNLMPNYTINTVGAYDSGNDRTPITINETAPGVTFAAGGRVINLTRNIELLDESAPTAQYGFNSYTERLQIDWNQQANMHRQYIKDALFLGFRQINGNAGANFDFENCVFHNCDQLFYNGADLYFKNTIFYSMYYVFYRTFGHLIDGGGFYAIDRIMNSSIWGMKIKNADLLNNQYCLYNYSNTIVGVNLNFRNNRYIARDCHDIKLKECVVDQFDYGFYTTYNVYARGSEFKNYTYLYSFTFTGSHFAVLEDCLLGTTRKPLRVYHTAAVAECLESGDTGWQSPPSGNSWILEITPKADIDARQNFFELSPVNVMAAYAETGSKTITFKIYPSGWSTALDQDDIYLEAYYLDQASGVSRALAVTGSGTFANGGWRDLTVTFNPAQAGTVYFNLILTRYEASAYVLVDPVWEMS